MAACSTLALVLLIVVTLAVKPAWMIASSAGCASSNPACSAAGECLSGVCECAAGYTGSSCETGLGADNVIGCFLQRSNSPLNRSVTLGCNTPGVCITSCRQLGFRYAGLSDGTRCWCGHSFPAMDKVLANDCNLVCPFEPSLGCGGSQRSLIFQAGYEFFPIGSRSISVQSSPVQ
eukprot:scpid89293/ scgid27159/ Xylosyltransferase oxt; Imaginal disk type I; Peptide O-xylosyltransferase